MDKKVNGKWFYACLLMLLFASGLQAQQAQIFKQHDMHRWGIPAGNYSGIAHIGNDRYALISDKQQADGWTEVSIAFLPSGDIASMQFVAHHYDANTLGHARDSEGIAYVPGHGFFVSAENDQQILELSSEGIPTSRRLQIPPCFAPSQIFPNRGFEALAYDAGQGIFWTTTEQSLRPDALEPASPQSPQPALLRLQSFGSDLRPLRQFAYRTEFPTSGGTFRHFAFGVPELLVIDDTTLLVLERELSVPQRRLRSKCTVRLFSVNPHARLALTDTNIPLDSLSSDRFLPKKQLFALQTGVRLFGKKDFANYEGMCQGPTLPDGRRTILLVADSQNRAGTSVFRLKDYIRVIVLEP